MNRFDFIRTPRSARKVKNKKAQRTARTYDTPAVPAIKSKPVTQNDSIVARSAQELEKEITYLKTINTKLYFKMQNYFDNQENSSDIMKAKNNIAAIIKKRFDELSQKECFDYAKIDVNCIRTLNYIIAQKSNSKVTLSQLLKLCRELNISISIEANNNKDAPTILGETFGTLVVVSKIESEINYEKANPLPDSKPAFDEKVIF